MSTFKSLNPTNLSDVVVETKLATPDEIADAARRARAAQKAWAKMPAPARGRVIANAGRLFENTKEALSKLVTREMGKVYREALGDVQEVIDTARLVTGREIKVVDSPRRAGDPARLVADARQARERLVWQPQFADLSTIIQHAWQWETNH